ncbi:MAG: hypothetical protein ACLPY5_07035 [Candidatus Bathyarchaeia archaeon]
MLSDFPQKARAEAFSEIEYCIPIFAAKIHLISMRHPKLRRTIELVLQNRRIVPKSMMCIAPYFIPLSTKVVSILLGRETMRQYEKTTNIYRHLLVDYLKQDLEDALTR